MRTQFTKTAPRAHDSQRKSGPTNFICLLDNREGLESLPVKISLQSPLISGPSSVKEALLEETDTKRPGGRHPSGSKPGREQTPQEGASDWGGDEGLS